MSTSYWSRLGEIDFSHTIARLVEGFTGREWLFESLDNWLNQEDGEKFYLLTGEPGVGKSAIAARLTQRWTENNPEAGKLAAYHFCRAGDVETVRPGRVVRSLASQLVNTLPQYKEALKEVIDPVYLNIKSEINIGTLSNSQVTGIYIENLKNLDPREEFRLLIQAPLAALSNIYASLGETPPSVKVLLIDSLDEAATTTGQENMVTLLASLYQARETLPPWIRFLLTARPDQSVLTRFLPLQAEKIEELEAKNLSDIQRYIQGRVNDQLREVRSTPAPQINNALVSNLKPLQQRLEEADLTAEKLMSEVKELSHGNFLYTKLLLNSIESGEQSIKNLSALPKNLNDIYHRILRYRCSFRGWLKRYQPILGVLSVAQEAITLEQLTKFIGIEPEELKQDLEVFQQFLDQSEDEQGEVIYSIFHQSLREYLLDKQNHDFWCDAKEQHESIIECFENESKKWQDLEAIDLYGLRHLAQHLVKGDQVDELHTILSLEEDGKNAWFKVKDGKGDTSGFLADVELAWAEADKRYKREPGRSIGLQCRYALIKTSINSLAGIPKELMIATVEHHYWEPIKALAYIHLIPTPIEKFKSLITLADQLSDLNPLKPQVLQSALEITETIPDTWQGASDRAEALIALVDKLPEALPKAFEAAQLISDDYPSLRVKALIALADKLPEALPKAFEVAQSIRNVHDRFQILVALADKSPEVLPKVFEAAQSIGGEHPFLCVKALIALADKLPEALPKAFEVAQSIRYEYDRAGALTALADKLPEAIPRAVEATQLIRNEYERTKLLIALVDKIPEILPEALKSARATCAARDVYGDSSRAEVLIALVDKIPEILPEALEATKAIDNEYNRVEALKMLAGKLPPHLLPKALEIAQAIQNDYERALALTALADQIPALLPKVLETIEVIQDEYQRLGALSQVAIKLVPELLPKAIQISQTFGSDNYRSGALEKIASRFKSSPNLLPELLEAAQAIQDQLACLQAIVALVETQSELFPEVVEVVQVFQDEHTRCQLLITLIGKSSPELLPMFLEIARGFSSEYNHMLALTALADKLPQALLHQVLETVQAFQDENNRSQILISLVDKLVPELMPKALEIAQTLSNEHNRATALKALISRSPEASLSTALKAAQAFEIVSIREQILAVLIDKICEIPLPKALEIIKALPHDYYRFEALTTLINTLPDSLMPEVLQAAQIIQDEYRYAQVLTILASKLPEALPLAYKAALLIQSELLRAEVLTALADKLPEALPMALEAAQAIQSNYSRLQALSALATKVPELQSQVLETAQTLEDELDRVRILSILAANLTEVRSKALDAASCIQNKYSRAEMLTTLVDKFPEAISPALAAVQAIDNDLTRALALETLAAKLPPQMLPKALEIAQDIEDEGDRSRAITWLADRLTPELLLKALESAQNVKSEFFRSQLLTGLANSLPPELFSEALEIAHSIQDDSYRAETLTAWVGKIPLELLPQALDTAKSIGDSSSRSQVLVALSSSLAQPPHTYSLWRDLLHFLSHRNRSNLLSDLAALANVINALGGEAGSTETMTAIRDAAKWWV